MSAGTDVYLSDPMAKEHIQTNYCKCPTLQRTTILKYQTEENREKSTKRFLNKIHRRFICSVRDKYRLRSV